LFKPLAPFIRHDNTPETQTFPGGPEMRTVRLTTTALVALILLLSVGDAAAFSFKSNGIDGSGDLETREFDLADFDAIEIGGAFEVSVTIGDDQELAVTIDDNLWDNLELEVHGGTLVVGWEKNCDPDDDCRLEIVVPSLKEMSISGAADVQIDDFEGDSFRFDLSGAADLKMNGEVDQLDIHISGAGDIDTRKLKARHAKIRISGAGNADIYASESLDARVSGVASIDCYGNPEEKRTNVSGLGKIRSR